jgi:hypothetical protein
MALLQGASDTSTQEGKLIVDVSAERAIPTARAAFTELGIAMESIAWYDIPLVAAPYEPPLAPCVRLAEVGQHSLLTEVWGPRASRDTCIGVCVAV